MIHDPDEYEEVRLAFKEGGRKHPLFDVQRKFEINHGTGHPMFLEDYRYWKWYRDLVTGEVTEQTPEEGIDLRHHRRRVAS